MSQTILAHFDGKAIVPDAPVEFPTDKQLRVSVEIVEPAEGPFASLLQFATDFPDSPGDMADQHDHYASGAPKR